MLSFLSQKLFCLTCGDLYCYNIVCPVFQNMVNSNLRQSFFSLSSMCDNFFLNVARDTCHHYIRDTVFANIIYVIY